jgi:hypothetical protein
MSINETITGNGTSSESAASATTTQCVVEATGGGMVMLEAKVPSSSNWVMITNETGAFPLDTPDPNITYRFRASGIKTPVRVYFQ